MLLLGPDHGLDYEVADLEEVEFLIFVVVVILLFLLDVPETQDLVYGVLQMQIGKIFIVKGPDYLGADRGVHVQL